MHKVSPKMNVFEKGISMKNNRGIAAIFFIRNEYIHSVFIFVTEGHQ